MTNKDLLRATIEWYKHIESCVISGGVIRRWAWYTYYRPESEWYSGLVWPGDR